MNADGFFPVSLSNAGSVKGAGLIMKNPVAVILMLFVLLLPSCLAPYSETLYPMERYLQGGWYRIGTGSASALSIGPMDSAETFEIFFFKGRKFEQYCRKDDCVELFTWDFLADDTILYRTNHTVGRTYAIGTHGDTLLIDKEPWYFWFCRYGAPGLPVSWPDSVVPGVIPEPDSIGT